MKYKGILAYLDQVPDLMGETFGPQCQVNLPILSVDVCVDSDPSQMVGFGYVTRVGIHLHYEIHLDTIKISARMASILTPCVEGTILARNGNEITHFKVTRIGLSLRPLDTRLTPLGFVQQAMGIADQLEAAFVKGLDTCSTASKACVHQEGSTPLMGWVICRKCGENIRKAGV